MSAFNMFSLLKKASQPESLDTPRFSLIDYLKKNLSSVEEIKPFGPRDNIRVSHVISMCPREEFYYYKSGDTRKISVSNTLRVTFDFGNAFHELIQQKWLRNILWGSWENVIDGKRVLIKESMCPGDGWRYIEKDPVRSDIGISGHIDGIAMIDGHKYIIELKSANAMSYEMIANKNRPLDKHVEQANCYMGLTGVKNAIILYLNKDTSSLMEFFISFDSKAFDENVKKVSDYRTHIGTGVPPRGVCTSEDVARAKKCAFKKVCFGG